MRLSWNALSLHVTLPAFSSPVHSGKLFFCHFGSLVLTYGSPHGPCYYVRLSWHFSLLVCAHRDFGCTGQFCLRFVYLGGSSFIFGIRFLMPFSFSSVFRPAVSQRPLLVFLVHFFRAQSVIYDFISYFASSYGEGIVSFSTCSATFGS